MAKEAMRPAASNLARERATVRAMVELACAGRHRSFKAFAETEGPSEPARGGLCAPCGALLDYAMERLRECPFGADKPTCNQCPVHCYGPENRERIKAVMAYAGPRMVFKHPVLALRHLLREKR